MRFMSPMPTVERDDAMTSVFASRALLPGGWSADVRIRFAGGIIAAIEPAVVPTADDHCCAVVVPALANLHSHAFQRAIAGLAEIGAASTDSFWTWRAAMYKFALSMTPDDVEAVAAQLYAEMLEAGFARVGEFHYLHHDRDGAPYAQRAEMAERIAAASAEAAIGLTLLPVFYAHAGFGAPASDEQRRFVNSPESFARLVESCSALVARLPGAVLGIAPHSLRAATLEEIAAILPLAGSGPVHIHVAEQAREIDDCLAATGARPVEYLLGGAPVDARWCLIHATHMTERETVALARSGAVAGLCPITEANLGDGIFPAPSFRAAGGRFGIGSDSNILVSAAAELRQLEYSQRLGLEARNVISGPGRSTGRTLFDHALAGGGAALGAPAGIAVGNLADLVSLDTGAVPYLSDDALLDAWIFGTGVTVDEVWAMGARQVSGGRHVRRTAIHRRFVATMARLLAA